MIAGDFGSVNTANGNISATYGNRGNVSMVKRKSRRIDLDVQNEIHRRVREGSFTNAAELHRELVEQFPEDAPSERTVRSIVKELTPPTTSGIWQPGPDADPEDAALILETVAEHMSRGKRRWPNIANDHAQWIAWLRRGWPDMDPVATLALSADYLSRREAGDSTKDLDGLLAFTPWRSSENAIRWQKAQDRGLPSPPLWYHTVVMAQLVQWGIKQEGEGVKKGEQS